MLPSKSMCGRELRVLAGASDGAPSAPSAATSTPASVLGAAGAVDDEAAMDASTGGGLRRPSCFGNERLRLVFCRFCVLA